MIAVSIKYYLLSLMNKISAICLEEYNIGHIELSTSIIF